MSGLDWATATAPTDDVRTCPSVTGLANVDAWRAPTATTIYEIGSITKPFTAAVGC